MTKMKWEPIHRNPEWKQKADDWEEKHGAKALAEGPKTTKELNELLSELDVARNLKLSEATELGEAFREANNKIIIYCTQNMELQDYLDANEEGSANELLRSKIKEAEVEERKWEEDADAIEMKLKTVIEETKEILERSLFLHGWNRYIGVYFNSPYEKE